MVSFYFSFLIFDFINSSYTLIFPICNSYCLIRILFPLIPPLLFL
nr:MAG TPA: hypothetical protein [Caudoviricetes sp.]